MLDFFGAEPVARAVEDGYWCNEISDKRGVTLTRWLTKRTVSHEGADRMPIRDGKLLFEFSTMGEKTTHSSVVVGDVVELADGVGHWLGVNTNLAASAGGLIRHD